MFVLDSLGCFITLNLHCKSTLYVINLIFGLSWLFHYFVWYRFQKNSKDCLHVQVYCKIYCCTLCLWEVFNLELVVYFWFEIMWFAKYIQFSYAAGATLLWKYRLPNVDPYANIWCLSCSLINLVLYRPFWDRLTWHGIPSGQNWILRDKMTLLCWMGIEFTNISGLLPEAQLRNKISDIETINALKTLELVTSEAKEYFSLVRQIGCTSL